MVVNKKTLDYRKEAYRLRDEEGINVCPLKVDGSKFPKINWGHLQKQFITNSEIEQHCKNCGGLAAITGSISNLICFDFDLDKQILGQDFWKKFNSNIPKELKKRFFVNQTRSGGYHIWLKLDNFKDKSRKIAHRLLTIEELYNRYTDALNNNNDVNLDALKVSNALIKKPLQCIIETRGQGSYGVMCHKDYKRVYGETVKSVSEEEYEFLLENAYSLDCGFKMREIYVGSKNDYKTIAKYNQDTTAEDVFDMMINTGLYLDAGVKSNGDLLLKRVGSNNKYSSVIFLETGNVYDFGISNIFSNNNNEVHTPFEVYCVTNNLEEEEALEQLNR